MAIISSIRKRGGLIAAVIFIALLSFVLGDFLFKGKGFFTSEQNVGEISGNTIPVIAFDNEVQQIADVQKERMHKAALDEETMNKIRDNVWEKFLNNLAFKPQFASAGISVSDNEVKECILGNDPDQMVVQYFSDPQTHQIIQYFRDPMTGRLKPSSVKTYVDSLPQDEKPRWAEFEDLLRDSRVQNKYLSLVKKGLYVTKAQAQMDYANLNRSVSFKYVVKSYSSLSDSSVKITDQDRLKFYNENSYKYKQDASRKLEYVIFDIKPTQVDFDEAKNQITKLSEEWKEIKIRKEDSLLVVRESDTRNFDTTYYAKGKLPVQIDSLAQSAEKGTMLPMYMENNKYKISKVMDYDMVPDSVKARHILIRIPGKDSLAKAKVKILIDSIKTVIKKKKNFEEMAKKFSDDGGSKEKGGDLGWFQTGRMVPEFQDACFKGQKGDMPIALSKILDQSERVRKTQVATIEMKIEPGTKTRSDVFAKTNDFVDKYHTTETFNKGVEEMHLIKYKADQLKESDKAISGIENPRDIIRWAFNAKRGDVSTEPFSFPDKYVVAHLAEIREEGIAPMEQKKDEVELGARKEKKAEKFIEEMSKINAKTIDEYASKLNLRVMPGEGATFTSYTIPGIGREMDLYGSLFAMKQGEVSKPVKGETGVFIVQVEKITEAPATTDYTAAKTQAKNNLSYRADMEVMETIKKKAKIKDNRAKFF
jgi:peptidyl-prolyl cis-trans isomerase D